MGAPRGQRRRVRRPHRPNRRNRPKRTGHSTETGLRGLLSTRPAGPNLRDLAQPLWIAVGLLVAGLLYAAADQGTGLMPWHRLEVEVSEAEARVRAGQVRNAHLAAQIRDLRDDPMALEAAIREVIGWVRPGELRVDVAAPPDALPAPPPHR